MVTSDGDVYYLSDEHELHRIRDEEDTTLAEDVVSMVVTAEDLPLFLTDYDRDDMEGVLCTLDQKDRIQKIDNHVSSVYNLDAYTYYETNMDPEESLCDIYASSGGTDFTLALEEAYSPYRFSWSLFFSSY